VQGHELSLAELLLGEPEIAAWLEPEETVHDEDEAEAGTRGVGS